MKKEKKERLEKERKYREVVKRYRTLNFLGFIFITAGLILTFFEQPAGHLFISVGIAMAVAFLFFSIYSLIKKRGMR
ncbi:MAG: hypothetical protein ABH874_04020 [Methanobacteriota archaeon]